MLMFNNLSQVHSLYITHKVVILLCPNSKKAPKSNSRRLFVFLSSPLSTAQMLISVGDHQFKIVGCVPHCQNFRMLTFLKLDFQFQQR